MTCEFSYVDEITINFVLLSSILTVKPLSLLTRKQQNSIKSKDNLKCMSEFVCLYVS